MNDRDFYRIFRALPRRTRQCIELVAILGEPAPGPTSAWLVSRLSSYELSCPRLWRHGGWKLFPRLGALVFLGTSSIPIAGLVAATLGLRDRWLAPRLHAAIETNRRIAAVPWD